jgi:hypothetical protein
LRIAVLQHRIRTHERMDLAAMLALSEHASEEGAQVIVYPCVPGLSAGATLVPAFMRNVEDRAPGTTAISPCVAKHLTGPPVASPTALGRTVVLAGDDCIDPALFDQVKALEPDALVWQFDAEDELQAEACLELALEATLTLAPLVIVAAVTGSARGVDVRGTSAVVHLGEILAEGGSSEDLLIADVQLPAVALERVKRVPEPAPVLRQRLAAHHGAKAQTGYPADLS